MFTNVINCLHNHFVCKRFYQNMLMTTYICRLFAYLSIEINSTETQVADMSNKIPKDGGYTVIRASPTYLHISKKSSGTPNFF